MITLLPTLKPAYFKHKPQVTPCLPFPLQQERARYYYFARNGIWEALAILGLKPGDEVLMPAFTSGIEVDVVTAYGLTPIFYALHEDLTPNLEDVEKKLSSRARVFYLIHYLGFPQPLKEIVPLCRAHRLFLFEDAALSFLSADEDNVPLGSTGDVGIFCPRKSVPIPHGGLLVVNNPALPMPSTPQRHPSRYATSRQLFALFLKRMTAHPHSLVEDLSRWGETRAVPVMRSMLARIGFNTTECGSFTFDASKTDWRMSAISRFLLSRFDYAAIKKQRRINYETLTTLLSDIKEVRLPFPVLPLHACPLDLMILTAQRDEVIANLFRNGIHTSTLWFEERSRQVGGSFPLIKKILHEHIVLPIHQDLDPSHMAHVAAAVRSVLSA